MSGTSTASEQVQPAAGGAAATGSGGPAAASTLPAGGDGGGGGGGAAGGATGGASTTSTASAVSLSAAALAQEGSDGLGALKGSPGGSPYRGSPRGGPTLTRSQTLGPNASSALDEKRERPSGLGRVFNPPKLERKHSSGDLHSRLKTRKILGVGETDNGDIHRSKISQVLGHNEHLYVKLPRGFWSAHVAMGVGVTLEAGLLLLTPRLASRVGVMPYDDDDDDDDTTASRVAGAALAGLCVFVWSLLGTSDKHYARTMLLSMLTYHILSICVTAASALTTTETVVVTPDGEEAAAEGGEAGGGGDGEGGLFGSRLALCVSVRAVMCLLCLAYFYSIAGYAPIRGQKPTGFRQPAHAHKDQ